jgi:hypothetical protein
MRIVALAVGSFESTDIPGTSLLIRWRARWPVVASISRGCAAGGLITTGWHFTGNYAVIWPTHD